MPAARFPFLDAPTPLAMAHRGGAIEHLENSMPAFEACVELGYRFIETDVQVTADGVLVNLDIKAAGVLAPLVRLVRRMQVLDRICLGSFSDARIAAARRLFGPAVCTSLGPRGVAALRLSSYSPRAAGLVRISAGCAQVPLQLGGRALVDERFLAAAHARGLQVHVWTVDDPAEAEAMLDLGVDGIMTDRPAMLRGVLEKRGQWDPPA
ncbi:glycerophosphodiester phosphodiesterase family protein [Blastococcus sp. KM273129]|uniref:glycerophosphodiester phosphodiesterase family protein n=1 Tax=Blastococcus sp. KM273129 TaxID=2570315 RepID=UPI001F2E55C2|nr:glycerophosphodiester phosphodiesterase family protein [Blastococcus sp. KM273129]MCF6734154.1 glycerophosphodiester phosphodiesterase [Blastococcus sp. KM273129]